MAINERFAVTHERFEGIYREVCCCSMRDVAWKNARGRLAFLEMFIGK